MGIEDQGVERRIRNEQIFRTVNTKLRELNAQFEDFAGETALFVCECSRLECIAQISVPVGVFDELQRQPGRYVLAAGHESPDVDEVVVRTAAYVVVEKSDA
jgi:hypothetical protein